VTYRVPTSLAVTWRPTALRPNLTTSIHFACNNWIADIKFNYLRWLVQTKRAASGVMPVTHVQVLYCTSFFCTRTSNRHVLFRARNLQKKNLGASRSDRHASSYTSFLYVCHRHYCSTPRLMTASANALCQEKVNSCIHFITPANNVGS